jgi:hypothetical protein
MTHGVAGTSKNATGQRNRTTPVRKPKTASRARATRTTASATNRARPTIDRDALLRSLFPNGIPPREDVISQVTVWLNEAERLARGR